MDEGLPPRIPFLPDLVLHHSRGAVVTGMEGEVLWLDRDMNPVSKVAVPFPVRVHRAAISQGHLYAMWLDRELLLAHMGSLPIGSSETGIGRDVLRTSLHASVTHRPAGHTWSHTLDAEPMALAAQDDTLVFALYRRGLYCTSTDAAERWRRPPPNWTYPRKRPRNGEIISIHIDGDHFIIASRGGRVQRRFLGTGNVSEEYLLPGVEGPIEHYFQNEGHELVTGPNGEVLWFKGQRLVQKVQLSGPVQYAVWDQRLEGWRLAGWREEVVLSAHQTARRPTNEIPIHVCPMGSGALVLFNDGSWQNSLFESSTPLEEE
jgi:hypothetical protein